MTGRHSRKTEISKQQQEIRDRDEDEDEKGGSRNRVFVLSFFTYTRPSRKDSTSPC
jgi:hypothetical protein